MFAFSRHCILVYTCEEGTGSAFLSRFFCIFMPLSLDQIHKLNFCAPLLSFTDLPTVHITTKSTTTNNGFVTLSAAGLTQGNRVLVFALLCSALRNSSVYFLLLLSSEGGIPLLSSALSSHSQHLRPGGGEDRGEEKKQTRNQINKQANKQTNKQNTRISSCRRLGAVYSVCRLHATSEQM